jgi:uncharacterized damage-inducible protein DinB
MAFKDALIPEFEHEMANTRKTLERVPEDKLAWKPHDRSMSLGHLARHLAEIPSWTGPTIEQDSLDMAGYKQPAEPKSRKEILDAFDQNVKAARAALDKLQDAWLGKPWTLKSGEQVYFSLPKGGVLRGFVFSHIIHHRAQLGVYLRLLNVPVPSIYGPSADEQNM